MKSLIEPLCQTRI